MTWAEWVLIGLVVYAVCDIIASIWTARLVERTIREVVVEEDVTQEEDQGS